MSIVFISGLTKITDTKFVIEYRHYKPFDTVDGLKKTKEQLEIEGKLVEIPKKLPDIGGKIQKMYYNPADNKAFYDYENIANNERIEALEKSNAEMMNLIATLATPTI